MPARREIVQHWILNIAIEFGRKLSDFLPFVQSERLNVHGVPSATPEDYAEGVLALFDSGSIRLYSDSVDEGGQIEANRSILESVLGQRLELPRREINLNPVGQSRRRSSRVIAEGGSDLRWELTPSGGKRWERRAQPDWSRYLAILTDCGSGEAWSADRDFLLAELGWGRELDGLEIDRNSIRLEILHDHAITYWKTLPIVYHAAFASGWAESPWLHADRAKAPDWFHDWWASRSNWYKQPWELPTWPKAS